MIELVPQVGSFVARGDPLFRVRGGGPVDAGALRDSIAIGPERTMEQDPRFVYGWNGRVVRVRRHGGPDRPTGPKRVVKSRPKTGNQRQPAAIRALPTG